MASKIRINKMEYFKIIIAKVIVAVYF